MTRATQAEERSEHELRWLTSIGSLPSDDVEAYLDSNEVDTFLSGYEGHALEAHRDELVELAVSAVHFSAVALKWVSTIDREKADQ